jgi:hypothetical protein
MPGRRGTLQKIADAVEDVVQTVAVETGLVENPLKPKPKAVRKAVRKAKVARAEKEKREARWTKR